MKPELKWAFLVQALHALALSSPELCEYKANPASFILRLAPYLKIAAPEKGQDVVEQRQAARQEAERLICLLPLISTLLDHLQVRLPHSVCVLVHCIQHPLHQPSWSPRLCVSLHFVSPVLSRKTYIFLPHPLHCACPLCSVY